MSKPVFLLLTIGLMAAAMAASGIQALAEEQKALYVGMETCAGCHEAQYESFIRNSKKAHSYESIRKMEKKLTRAEFQECFACHTTGYGRPGGFISSKETPDLKNPGCEVCHGPGSLHAESSDPKDLGEKVSLAVCQTCHNSERVAAFGFKPILFAGAH